jgi:two-component system nitrate/nitrite response regulator NarL
MSIKVLLADDSDIIRGAILKVLSEEPGFELVGEGASYADAIQLTARLKPDVLLLDLHMPDEEQYPPELVKSQIAPHNVCIIAISVWNDDKARALAESFGAKAFLDKTSLYSTLIPAIKSCVAAPNKPLQRAKKASGSAM